jgi:hypothetical protein
MKTFSKRVLVGTVICLLFQQCDWVYRFFPRVDRTLDILQEASTNLNNQSISWQETLENTTRQLTEDAQSTIRTEVQQTLDRAIAASGQEIKCTADFFRTRAKADIDRIIARLKGDPEQSISQPVVCGVIPESGIDMNVEPNRRNAIEWYGYDFDKTRCKVYLLNQAGSQTDITEFLTQQSHYHMTLKPMEFR